MEYRDFDLQLFGDGDAAPAGGEGITGATEQAAAAPELPVYKKRQGINKLNRQKQEAPAAAAEQQEPQADDSVTLGAQESKASFDDLIKGDYKQDFDNRVQDIVKRRMKGSEKAKQRLDSLEPLVKVLAEKYGIAADDEIDPQSIMNAIMDDDSMWEEAAMKKGMPVDEFKEWNREHREYQELKEEKRMQQESAASAQAFRTIQDEATALMTKYPTLDFAQEMSDPKFCEEVAFHQRRGEKNPFQKAYESKHFEELMGQLTRSAQQHAVKQVADNVAANRARPAENGAAQSGVATVIDPSTFKAKDFADIRKRMARGEKITF